MSNPEVMNTIINEVSMNATENCGSNDEIRTIGTHHNVNFVKNFKENSNVSKYAKENYSQKVLFGKDKNMSSTVENDSNELCNRDSFSNGSNENLQPNVTKEDNCPNCLHSCQHKGNLQESKAADSLMSFAMGNNTTGENISDNTNCSENKSLLNDECLPSDDSQSDTLSIEERGDASMEVKLDKPQPMCPNFNIVPNPNEFDLVGKSNISLQNSNFANLNQSSNEILALADNSIVISNSNAIPQSDSIVSSNYSLSQLLQYISDDDDDDCLIEKLPVAPLQYREGDQQMQDSDDSDSSTSSSTSIFITDSSSDSDSEDEYENNKPTFKPIKAKGEMDLNDLPPIEDLSISVPEDECIPIGKIYQIVDQLVIVQANKDTPAYDLDTVLFTQGGKPLGKVFDVMGPVTEPYYCIRFNSKDHIKQHNITLDQTVYVAPKSQYSKFVFLAQLMQLKGSDASWENDHEPPDIFLDYSDDEQEQRAKKKFYRNKKAVFKTDSDSDEPARKRHAAYVKKMNARNLKLSAARSNQNPVKSRAENGNILWQPNLSAMMGASPLPPRPVIPSHQMFGRPAMFDMRVPPPNSSFFGQGGPLIGRPDFSVYPHVFTGPSTSSRAQGPSPFLRPSISQGPPPFAGQCASPGPPSFPRPCVSPGTSTAPRMPPFSSPPAYCQLPNNQGLNSTPSMWNPSFPKPENQWATPFSPYPPRNGPPLRCAAPPPPPPPPMRSSLPHPMRRSAPPPPPIGTFTFPMDFPNRASSPHGPNFNSLQPWSGPLNNQGNSPQYNFNPSVPPPSPNFFQN